jgi:hypothetical protein
LTVRPPFFYSHRGNFFENILPPELSFANFPIAISERHPQSPFEKLDVLNRICSFFASSGRRR